MNKIAVGGYIHKGESSLVNGTNDREACPKRWIAVLVQVNCEKKTATRLGKVGYETYIPTQQEVHQWSDRKKKVDRLIMPMLVFVRATVREEEWLRDQSYIHKLLALPGSDEDKKRFATPIPDNQIERLKFLLENAGAALGMQELPALYLQYYYAINAFTSSLRHDCNNYRVYTHDEMLLVLVLKYYKQMGFKLDEMKEFITGGGANILMCHLENLLQGNALVCKDFQKTS